MVKLPHKKHFATHSKLSDTLKETDKHNISTKNDTSSWHPVLLHPKSFTFKCPCLLTRLGSRIHLEKLTPWINVMVTVCLVVTKTSSRCEVLNNGGCSVEAPIAAVSSELSVQRDGQVSPITLQGFCKGPPPYKAFSIAVSQTCGT